jgi:hypothetical protein
MTLGINSKLYYNSGTFGSPTWVEMSNVSDCKVDSNWDDADGSTRASPVKMSEPTQLNLGVGGKMLPDQSVGYLLMQTRYYARTLIDIMALDGGSATNTAEGVRFEAKITTWAEDQGLGNVNFRDFMLKPCVRPTRRSR